MAISRDGKTYAFSTGNGYATREGERRRGVAVWDASAGRVARVLPEGSELVGQLALSPDGKTLYGGGTYDRFVTSPLGVWDVATGALLRTRRTSVWALSGDGATLVTVDVDPGSIDPGMTPGAPVIPASSTVTIWNTADFTPRRSFKRTVCAIGAVAVSADGSRVVCGEGSDVFALDPLTGKDLWRAKVEKEELSSPEIFSLLISPDGKLIASVEQRYFPPRHWVRLWDTATGEHRHLLTRTDRPPTDQPMIVGLTFAPDNGRLFLGYSDELVGFWDVATGKPVLVNPRPPAAGHTGDTPRLGGLQPDDLEHLFAAALSPDGTRAVLGGIFKQDRCGLRVIDTATRAVLFPPHKIEPVTAPVPADGPFPYTHAVWWRSPENSHAGSIPLPGGAALRWNVLYGRLALIAADGQTAVREFRRDQFLTFAVSADGETLVTRGFARGSDRNIDDPFLRFWDVATGREWGQIPGPSWGRTWARRPLRTSPDGRTLATVHDDGGMWLWEIATLKPRLRLDPAGTTDTFGFTFSRDGRYLFANDYHGQSGLVWDLSAPPPGVPAGREKLSADGLAVAWGALCRDDAAEAYQAVWRFAADPAAAVPFLRKKAVGEPAVPASALAERPFAMPVVVARRLVEALERIGTPDATEVLAELAAGPRPQFTGPAAAAVARLKAKP
jgi:WD40 repeat protein